MSSDTLQGGTTIVVSDAASLANAYQTLSTTSGGGTILIAPGVSINEIGLSGGGQEYVTIASQDPNNQAVIGRINIQNADNITLSGLDVDSTGISRPDWNNDIDISGSSNITIENSTFQSTATQFYDINNPSIALGEQLGIVRNSQDFTFDNNYVAGYSTGLNVWETVGVTISDNEITQMQADGLRFAGVQNVEISGNYMYDFFGSTYEYNHDDMIQFWTTNTNLLTQNVVIKDNVLMSGDGVATQSIFFGNEQVGQGDMSRFYNNIEITNNLIYNGHTHGITLYSANNVTVANNTVLWDQDARIVGVNDPLDGGNNWAPQIKVFGSTGLSVYDNIATYVKVNGVNDPANNNFVNYNNPSDPAYVGTNIPGYSPNGTVAPADLLIDPSSPWFGDGATSLPSSVTGVSGTGGSTGTSGGGTTDTSGGGTTDTSGGGTTDTSGGGTTDTSGGGSTDTSGGTDATTDTGSGTDTNSGGTHNSGGATTAPDTGGTDTTPDTGGADTSPDTGGTDTSPDTGGTDTTTDTGGTHNTTDTGGVDLAGSAPTPALSSANPIEASTATFSASLAAPALATTDTGTTPADDATYETTLDAVSDTKNSFKAFNKESGDGTRFGGKKAWKEFMESQKSDTNSDTDTSTLADTPVLTVVDTSTSTADTGTTDTSSYEAMLSDITSPTYTKAQKLIFGKNAKTVEQDATDIGGVPITEIVPETSEEISEIDPHSLVVGF